MEPKTFLITNVLIPNDDEGYSTANVALKDGKIYKIFPSSIPIPEELLSFEVLDGTDKLLLPGMVNAHTHSIQQWGRGLVKPLPLELWLPEIYTIADPRSRDPSVSSHVVYLATLHAGVETLMSGGTSIMDHLNVRNMDDIEAAVKGYNQSGIRAFIAPMMGDLARTNYIPLVPNAKELNSEARKNETKLGGLGEDGEMREHFSSKDEETTKKVLSMWREAVEKFHDPDNGIYIAIGPVQVTSVTEELMKGAVELRKKFNLAGHIHLLETRGQRLQSRQMFADGGAVDWLSKIGWLDLPGTSCAHAVWLEDEEQKMIAKAGAVVVHNPVANCRLGSGIAPIRDYLNNGMKVAIGCDGPASNDGQNLHEALKLACILNPLTGPDYRSWLTPRKTLQCATEGGASALGLENRVGVLKEGFDADLVMYDLTALSLLPRTDPIGLLVLGRPGFGVGGNALHSVWVRGKLVIQNGVPLYVDLNYLKNELIENQKNYLNLFSKNPNSEFEVEYRACLGLDAPISPIDDPKIVSNFPTYRVNYDADIPYCANCDA